MPISPTYLHKKGLSQIFFERWDDGVTELTLSPVLQWQSAGAGAWGLFAVGLRPERPPESIAFPKADPSQLFRTGFQAGFLSVGGCAGGRNSEPRPDNQPKTTTGPRISCNLERRKPHEVGV